MSQHNQKFEACMFEYCSLIAERSYKLIEDNEVDEGHAKIGHLADILQFLIEARSSSGVVNISSFAILVKELDEIEKDEVYAHLQNHGFGQYIPE